MAARLENLADGVEPATPVALGEVLAQAQRLGGLVADLLDLSRVDAGLAPLVLGVDVARLVEEARADVALPGRAATYAVRVEPGLDVTGDRARLRQLVVNLLDNAVRHGPPGGTVVVSAERSPTGWWLEVRDEGPGVPAAERDRVFERFGTLQGVTGGGTGLGLAVARWVAQLHGGRIGFLDSDPTVGARVRADLPLPTRPTRRPLRPLAGQEDPVTRATAPSSRPPRPRVSTSAGPGLAVRRLLARPCPGTPGLVGAAALADCWRP